MDLSFTGSTGRPECDGGRGARRSSIRNGLSMMGSLLALSLGCGEKAAETPLDSGKEAAATSETTADGGRGFVDGAFDEESGEEGAPADDWLCGSSDACEQRVMTVGEITDDGISTTAVFEQIDARNIRLAWAIDGMADTQLEIHPFELGAAEMIERFGSECEQPHNFSLGHCPGGLVMTSPVRFVTRDGVVEGEGRMRVTVDVPAGSNRGLYMIDARLWLVEMTGTLGDTVRIDGTAHRLEYLDVACSGLSTTPEGDLPECWIHSQDGLELAVTLDD